MKSFIYSSDTMLLKAQGMMMDLIHQAVAMLSYTTGNYGGLCHSVGVENYALYQRLLLCYHTVRVVRFSYVRSGGWHCYDALLKR